MSNNLDISIGSFTADNCANDTPCHSTPKYKNSFSQHSLDSERQSDVENHLRQLLHQRDNDFMILLNAYENVLQAWQQEKNVDSNGQDIIKGKYVGSLGSPNTDHVSIVSESTKDSGRITESPENPLESLPSSLSVLELIKDLSSQYTQTEQELERCKNANTEMQKQIMELTYELDEYKKKNSQNHSNGGQSTNDLKLLLKNQTLEEELAERQMTEEKLKHELSAVEKLHKQARREIEHLKGEIVNLKKECGRAKKSKEHLKQKILKLQLNDGKIELQDEKQLSTLNEYQHMQKNLHLALCTLKMLLDRQTDIVHMCMESIMIPDSKVVRMDAGENNKHSIANMKILQKTLAEFINLSKDIKESKLLKSFSEKNSVKHYAEDCDEKIKIIFDNQGKKTLMENGKDKLDFSVLSVCNDDSLQKLSRLLVTSHEMLTMISR